MNKYEQDLLKDFNINLTILKSTFGQQAISRGVGYYRSGKVDHFEDIHDREGGGYSVVASVEGSDGYYYNTELGIYSIKNTLMVGSMCDCPVGRSCKHGIAVLLTFVEAMNTIDLGDDDSSEQLVDDWLTNFAQVEQVSKQGIVDVDDDDFVLTPPVVQSYHLVYLLDIKDLEYEDQKSGFRVQPMKAKALKNGGYGKAFKLKYDDVNTDNYSESKVYCNPTDKLAITTLTGASTYNPHNYSRFAASDLDKEFFLEGEIGQLSLDKILATNRCFWRTTKNKPFSKGEVRKILLTWVNKDKQIFCKIKSEPAIQALFQLEELCYIDEVKNQYGILQHDSLTMQQVIHLFSAPPIPEDKAVEVSEKLLQILPEAEVPLPEPIDITTIEINENKPVFQLKLHALPWRTTGDTSKLIHIASLSFSYADISIQPKNELELRRNTSIVLDKKTRYKIKRNNQQEMLAVERLHALGFKNWSHTTHTKQSGLLYMYLPGDNLADSVLNWDVFRRDNLPILEQEGWQVSIDDSFSLVVETLDDWQAEITESSEEGKSDWFEMRLGFELDGKSINMLPLVVDLLASSSSSEELHKSLQGKEHQLLQVGDYQWIKIATARILLILDTLLELYDTGALNSEGNLEFSKHGALHYGDLLTDSALNWKGAGELQELSNKLKDFSGIAQVAIPTALQAELRDYQKEGLNWLQFLRDYQLNGILADDMGLGKTVQALASLLKEQEAGRATLPSLVIAPTSLMSNWRREAEKFAPNMKVLILQGSDRKEKFADILNYDLVLTTYPLMIRDVDFYAGQSFHYLILDEAQAIKNSRSKTTQLIYALKANHLLCLTGTPIENHLGELWSMFHFLMPGYLGTQEKFNNLFRTPIEKHGDSIRGAQLRKRVQPFMLRRTKDLVAKDLPEKTEIILSVPLASKQRELYETVRLAMDKKVRDEISKKGLARSQIMILDALLKLRQVCCDPRLVKLEKAKKVKESAKMNLLMDMLPEMVEEGRKILLFSQFTSMLSIIEEELNKRAITYSKLTGQTRKREEAINAFQEGDAKVFLISLKAGGVGLNLTAADVVIHYDPWWNPAVEKQATDRAHRMGQDKPVFVYKLLTEETVEEKILKLQEKKQQLADAIYKGKGKNDFALAQNELMDLLKPLE